MTGLLFDITRQALGLTLKSLTLDTYRQYYNVRAHAS
jgi:hypothetical protein